MKLTKKMLPLISALEYEIGSHCYNANSYNGWLDEYGCSFRYPVTYETRSGDRIVQEKSRGSLIPDSNINVNNIESICYKFGSNELHIALAIIDVLNMLENRYGIDFNALEKAYQSSKRCK